MYIVQTAILRFSMARFQVSDNMRSSRVNIEFAVADTELTALISPLLNTPSPNPGPSSDLPLR